MSKKHPAYCQHEWAKRLLWVKSKKNDEWWESLVKRHSFYPWFGFQFYPRIVFTNSLQTDPFGLRLGAEQQGHREQSQGLPSVSLRESTDAVVRSLPWFLHGTYSGILELQFYGWVVSSVTLFQEVVLVSTRYEKPFLIIFNQVTSPISLLFQKQKF